LNKLESLRKTLIQARKDLHEITNRRRKLTWQYRGHNIEPETYQQQYQELIRQQQKLAEKVRQIEFEILLQRLEIELQNNRYIICYFRSLTHGLPDQLGNAQILTTEIRLPCNHKLNIIKHIASMERTQAELFASRLLDTINEIKRIETGTRGVHEFRIRCPKCKTEYALAIELKPIPKEATA